MIIWTHRLMAEYVFEAVSASHRDILDRKAFIRGNILPDLNSRHRQFRHCTHDCWDYLESLAEEMDRLLCSTERGSEKMGIMCHFIADFFCMVHNRPYSETVSLLDHVLYEYQLHRLYRAMSRKKTLFQGTSVISQPVHIDSCHQWIKTRLSVMHRDYLNKQPDLQRDLTGALSACVAYCIAMIDLEKRQLSVFIPDAIA